jgi:hypothetical protein
VLKLEIPKNGRLERYLKELTPIFEHFEYSTKSDLESFMWRVFDDCMNYLKEVLGATFPNIMVNAIYKEEEWAELQKKVERVFGPQPYSMAMIIGSGPNAIINIYVPDHYTGNALSFIVNLCSSYFEELIHSINPEKTETETQEPVWSAIEGFLEIKLSDESKKEGLRRAKLYDSL